MRVDYETLDWLRDQNLTIDGDSRDSVRFLRLLASANSVLEDRCRALITSRAENVSGLDRGSPDLRNLIEEMAAVLGVNVAPEA